MEFFPTGLTLLFQVSNNFSTPNLSLFLLVATEPTREFVEPGTTIKALEVTEPIHDYFYLTVVTQ
jgi:hypothetical protein